MLHPCYATKLSAECLGGNILRADDRQKCSECWESCCDSYRHYQWYNKLIFIEVNTGSWLGI